MKIQLCLCSTSAERLFPAEQGAFFLTASARCEAASPVCAPSRPCDKPHSAAPGS